MVTERDSEENNWGFGSDDPVNAAAGGLYGFHVGLVREEVEQYDIGAARLRRTFEAARLEADRSSAILLFALAEDIMLSGLRQHLRGEVAGGWDELSSGNGLLATANDRLSLLALLSWIHPTVYADLRILKSIRNRFAHHPEVIGFDEPWVRSQIANLAPLEAKVMETFGLAAGTKLSPRQLFLVRAANTLIRLVFNLAIAPAARRENVAPGALEGPWDRLPPNLQELHRVLAEHLLAIITPLLPEQRDPS